MLLKSVHTKFLFSAPLLSQGEASQLAAQRAYHPDELCRQDHLQVDTGYYLRHQVHAVVSRLCEPIEGLDAAGIAECLGQWLL